MQESVQKLIKGENLSAVDAQQALGTIMTGGATDAQIGAFLVALRMKGETVEEITGCARTMREHATPIKVDVSDHIDTCGTGGDGLATFNISTAAAFVAAGAGIPVAKHGNRSVSSRCGSADVLKALGVNVEADVPTIEKCIAEAGIGFLFAPLLHGAMKYAIGPRRELGVRTVFNLLGPLTNPAGARRQVIGVFDEAWVGPMAEVLMALGGEHGMVVHGADGLDEISISGPTQVAHFRDGKLEQYQLQPADLGVESHPVSALEGGDPEDNARIMRDVLAGTPGPYRESVVANAAAALVVGGKVDELADGARTAAEVIDSGAARERLEALVRVSNAA